MSSLVSLLALVNPLAAAPAFLQATRGMPEARRRQVVRTSAAATTLVIAGAAWVGGPLLRLLGLPLGSLQVAGGLVLLAHALPGLGPGRGAGEAPSAQEPGTAPASLAVVPLTVPLLVGPATVALVVAGAAEGGPSRWTGYALVAGLCVLGAFSAARVGARALSAPALDLLGRVGALVLAALAVDAIAAGLRALLPGLASAG